MSTMATIENLRDISQKCLAEEPLTDDQARWLGDCLSNFLSHRCGTMDEAFELRFARGGVPWWREEAIRKRNAALQELGARFFPQLSLHARAERIAEMSLRYAATAWRFDRDKDAAPAPYIGTPKEYLWEAFSSGASMPLSQRQLRNILY